MNALAAGIVAGLAVAIPLGAIGVLIVDLGVRGGFRPAFLAGLGTALADGLYATVAAVAGLAVGAWLAPAERAIALVAAAALAAIGLYGLLALRRAAERAVPPADHRLVARFLALTAVNPATAATFAGLMLGLPAVAHASAPGEAAFLVGAFGASLAGEDARRRRRLMRHGLPPERADLDVGRRPAAGARRWRCGSPSGPSRQAQDDALAGRQQQRPRDRLAVALAARA